METIRSGIRKTEDDHIKLEFVHNSKQFYIDFESKDQESLKQFLNYLLSLIENDEIKIQYDPVDQYKKTLHDEVAKEYVEKLSAEITMIQQSKPKKQQITNKVTPHEEK